MLHLRLLFQRALVSGEAKVVKPAARPCRSPKSVVD